MTPHPDSPLPSQLGGPSADDDGRYRLGDDALEVLRDLKRWIRFYDEKTNRMDVARCLAEANVVEGDLLPILALWTEAEADNRYRARVALACLELLVPLTWPFERDPERTTVNHHRHMPVLELAQVAYKKAVINYDAAQVLHTAVRVALPSMAAPARERTARDTGIIRLALYFLRNMAMIAPAPGAKHHGDESQVSRSATINAFAYQDIFLVLLTVASNMGDDFDAEDMTLMDVVFHLVKQVDVERLYMAEEQLNEHKDQQLISMMAREAQMRQGYKKASGRHNRFGAMVWVQRDGHKMSTVSGADALLDSATRQRKMDGSKSYRPPRRGARKEEPDVIALGGPVSLSARANEQLCGFVDDFLDSGFNPLFMHVRKSIDVDAPQVLGYHRRQFFYSVAWFLQAERMRRRKGKAEKKKGDAVEKGKGRASGGGDGGGGEDSVGSFNLVAGVLNQEMFITVSRAMHQALEAKEWRYLTQVMRCFTEILVTVQEMRECGNPDDEEIAENILARLFYEDATHDCVANIVRSYKDQGFDYLDAATDLAHHFLRILEAYSRQNVDMQVRSRRAKRKKKKQATKKRNADDVDDDAEEDGGPPPSDEEDDAARAERTTTERKFDFGRFAARFCTQGAVNTFLAFARFYRDLDDGQLKRAHRYFYRLCFKQDLCTMMFRVDIIHLLHGMVKGPDAMDKTSAMFKDWEELARQILKRAVRKLQERPELVVELLFSKMSSTLFFLDHGFDKPAAGAGGAGGPRPAAELEFRHATEKGEQVAIVVGAMLDKGQADLLAWVRDVLGKAEAERRAWEASNEAISAVAGEGAEGAEGGGPEADPFGEWRGRERRKVLAEM
jgi:replication fork protection complex subunit Tof1/Swi1